MTISAYLCKSGDLPSAVSHAGDRHTGFVFKPQSVNRTLNIHPRFIVSPSSFFRTAAAILSFAFHSVTRHIFNKAEDNPADSSMSYEGMSNDLFG